eukprot:CAMPEP_0195516618 /NCGR_PEP_ID=MMETSP0794_2-20130614/8047_1 /TAXON_ID=515487 /ORGANISM="Stephanopyxis turris, Strain CCMP 815" /LENGTH=62 /DNA_ID=CAMNT_0040645265 /DNA_START=51 /DNA_END=239 /DNA_ORIENTATION=-
MGPQSLQTNLCAAPVAALDVVTDGVVRLQAEPLGDRAVLAHLLSESALGAEGLLGRHGAVEG